MRFLVIDGDGSTSAHELPQSQLMLHSFQGTDEDSDTVRAMVHSSTLVGLCQHLLETSILPARVAPDLSVMALALLHENFAVSRNSIRLVTPKRTAMQLFSVDDLLEPGKLVIFVSRWESLASAAVIVPKLGQRPQRDLSNSGRARLEDHNKNSRGNREPPLSRLAAFPGRGLETATKIAYAETHFHSVHPATLHDLDLLNRLLLAGTIRLDPKVETYLCSVCGCLPRQTLTTSCCGAVMCAMCIPLISTTTSGMSTVREKYMCAVCHEFPFTSHVTHPNRDAEIMRLVRELRVLHHPQFVAASATTVHCGPNEPRHQPIPIMMRNMGMAPTKHDVANATAPVLGSIFQNQ
ncbi:unnamed protein product [Trypanosoma congolense IL3000]|uniref:WGS project CAEQ00000000 data, annotated contig 1857 n=1 Tax=Trypanosoma congolense (strain IL3000) TaxID=1068625 RepID=F9W9G3_TRYCI|nr:unnamed protein product [Trypanosoma congolense IL3000]